MCKACIVKPLWVFRFEMSWRGAIVKPMDGRMAGWQDVSSTLPAPLRTVCSSITGHPPTSHSNCGSLEGGLAGVLDEDLSMWRSACRLGILEEP